MSSNLQQVDTAKTLHLLQVSLLSNRLLNQTVRQKTPERRENTLSVLPVFGSLPVPDFFEQRFLLVVGKLSRERPGNVGEVGVRRHQDDSQRLRLPTSENWKQTRRSSIQNKPKTNSQQLLKHHLAKLKDLKIQSILAKTAFARLGLQDKQDTFSSVSKRHQTPKCIYFGIHFQLSIGALMAS